MADGSSPPAPKKPLRVGPPPRPTPGPSRPVVTLAPAPTPPPPAQEEDPDLLVDAAASPSEASVDQLWEWLRESEDAAEVAVASRNALVEDLKYSERLRYTSSVLAKDLYKNLRATEWDAERASRRLAAREVLLGVSTSEKDRLLEALLEERQETERMKKLVETERVLRAVKAAELARAEEALKEERAYSKDLRSAVDEWAAAYAELEESVASDAAPAPAAPAPANITKPAPAPSPPAIFTTLPTSSGLAVNQADSGLSNGGAGTAASTSASTTKTVENVLSKMKRMVSLL